MRSRLERAIVPFALVLTFALAAGVSFAADELPAWAYGTPPAAPAGSPAAGRGGRGAAAPDTSPKHLAGSTAEFTRAQISDGFGPADWYPGDHPQMPEIVAHSSEARRVGHRRP